jgi:hypothetical protein
VTTWVSTPFITTTALQVAAARRAASRTGANLVYLDPTEPRHLPGVWRQDKAAGEGGDACPVREAGERRGVDEKRGGALHGGQASREGGGGVRIEHSRPDHHRVRVDDHVVQIGPGGNLAGPRGSHGDHPRLGHGEAKGRGIARRRGDLELSRAGAQGPVRDEQRGAGDLRAATDHQDSAARVLVRFLRQGRQRQAAKELGRDRFDPAHRAATLASGAVVTGAPARSSGAVKL